MAFFEVDAQRCKRDDICIAECPIHIIISDRDSGVPKMRDGAESVCIRCGHCVAVCPHGAVRIEDMPIEAFTPVDKSLAIDARQAEQFLRGRRSIRTFRDTPVPHDQLAQIMETVRWAPSASHKQPVHWVMVETLSAVREMAELVVDWMTEVRKENPELARRFNVAGLIAGWRKGQDLILRGAPHLAVAWTEPAATWPEVDCAVALTYLELAAHAHGVGCCWAGYFTYAANAYGPLREALGLPQDARVCGGQMMGYARFRYRRLPWRKPLAIDWK